MSHPAKAPPIGLLMAVCVIGPMAMHLLVPALPSLQRHFAADYGTTQLLVSLYMVTFGAMQILVGPFADAWGRRRVLLGGLIVFCGISMLCAMATSIEVLVALRVLQGAAGCVGLVLARAIVRDVFGEKDTPRLLGYLSMGIAVGPMLSPALGGLLYENFGWSSIFWFLAVFSGAALAMCWLLVPETSLREPSRFRFSVLFADFAALLRHRGFVLNGASLCANTAIFYCFVISAPYIAERMPGMTPTAYGLWFCLVALGYALGNFAAGRVAFRLDPPRSVLFGSVAACAFVALMAAFFATGNGTPLTLFVTMGAVTFASGFVMPNSLAGVLAADPDKAGSASGFVGFMQFAFAAAFTYVMGLATEGGQSAMPMLAFMFAAALMGLASAALLVFGANAPRR